MTADELTATARALVAPGKGILAADEGEDRVRATYGDNFDRLVQVKQRYDPDNLFRSNRNIRGPV